MCLGVIDLENFVRGRNEKDPNKGMILYSAVVTERPYFEQFTRCADHSIMENFAAYFTGGVAGMQREQAIEAEDRFYTHHRDHTMKFGSGRRLNVSFCRRYLEFMM